MVAPNSMNLTNFAHRATGDGRVFLYDLMQDCQRPVKTLDVCNAAEPVYSLSFNVKAPELFATTHYRSVKVSLSVAVSML